MGIPSKTERQASGNFWLPRSFWWFGMSLKRNVKIDQHRSLWDT